jgi:hypothetical protein
MQQSSEPIEEMIQEHTGVVSRRDVIRGLSIGGLATGYLLLRNPDRAEATRVQQVPIGTPVFRFFDVTDYGARGDGANDDTNPIRDAIAAAGPSRGVVFFPIGTYKTTSTITITHPSIMLLGSGGRNGGTRIVAALPSGSSSVFEVDAHAVIFRDLSIANGPHGSCLWLRATASKFAHRIEDCAFNNQTGNPSDLVLFEGSYSMIRGSEFGVQEPSAYGIRALHNGSAININSSIRENFFYGPGRGLLVDAASASARVEGLDVSGNVFLNTGDEQVAVKSVLQLNLMGNILDQASFRSVHFLRYWLPMDTVVISNNYIATAQSPQEGIAIDAGSGPGATVSNLRVFGNRIGFCGYGIIIGQDVGDASVTNNAIGPIHHTGVTLDRAGRVLIHGNHFSSNDFWLAGSDDGGSKYLIKQNFVSGNEFITVNNSTRWVKSENY